MHFSPWIRLVLYITCVILDNTCDAVPESLWDEWLMIKCCSSSQLLPWWYWVCCRCCRADFAPTSVCHQRSRRQRRTSPGELSNSTSCLGEPTQLALCLRVPGSMSPWVQGSWGLQVPGSTSPGVHGSQGSLVLGFTSPGVGPWILGFTRSMDSRVHEYWGP